MLIPYTTLLFSVNQAINFREIGLNVTDRFLVLPFNATFTDKKGNRDINIEERLCQDLPLQIIATRAIQAFNKVFDNGMFTIPDTVKKATNRYFKECNNAVDFCTSYPIETFIEKRQYFIEYSTWCEENNIQALDKFNFGKVVSAFGYKSKRYTFDHIRKHYYVNSKLNTERCYRIHRNFELDKEIGIISNKNMTFEEYLGKCLFRKEQEELEKQEDEELKKQEPEEIFFE